MLTLVLCGTGLAVLTMGMLLRDRILSGWLVFPLSSWSLDVAGLSPDAGALRAATTANARSPGTGLQSASADFSWIASWLRYQPNQWEFWLATTLALLLVGLAVWARRRRVVVEWRRLALAVAPCVTYLVCWLLLLPPTWRLAWGAGFGVPIVIGGWVLFAARMRTDVVAVLALGVLLCAAVVSVAFRYPAKQEPLPTVAVTSVTLPTGLTITQPTVGDQCWSASPLCTSLPAPGLRLIGSGIESGFASRR